MEEEKNEEVEVIDEPKDEEVEVIDEPKEEVVEENTESETVESDTTDTQESDSGSEVVREEKPKKKNPVAKVIIILLVLILVGVLGYIAFLKFKPDNKTATAEKEDYQSEYRLSGNGLENFDLYFLKLENEAKNKVYSPLSIKYALAMLSEGANGDSKAQIDAIIGDYKAKSYPNNEHMSFANAMFIRDTYKDKVKESYTNNLKEKFGAEVVLDPFASPDNINNWASDRTFKLVNNLLNDVSDNDFFLINALAIDMNWNNQIHCEGSHKIPCVDEGNYHVYYNHEKLEENDKGAYSVSDISYSDEDSFYATWNNKHVFDGKEFTKGGEVFADFNKYDIIKDLGEDKIREIIKPEYEAWLKTDEGKSVVSYNPKALNVEESINNFIDELKSNYGKADNSTDFLVHEDDNVKVFAKDLQEYDGMTLQYVGIMPKQVKLAEYIDNTNSDELNGIIKKLKEVNIDSFEDGYAYQIRGFIPFFKYEDELNLVDDLNKLGVKDVFDKDKADLSNMVEEKETFINKAVHKANIEFGNDGIRASAVTAMGGGGATSGPFFEHLFKIPVKYIDVTFDKPYMYIIRDKESGEVWFTGTVYEPIRK